MSELKLTQKRTCNKCAALWEDGANRFYCKLGYETIDILRRTKYGTKDELNPKEPCPKPKTFDQYMTIKKQSN